MVDHRSRVGEHRQGRRGPRRRQGGQSAARRGTDRGQRAHGPRLCAERGLPDRSRDRLPDEHDAALARHPARQGRPGDRGADRRGAAASFALRHQGRRRDRSRAHRTRRRRRAPRLRRRSGATPSPCAAPTTAPPAEYVRPQALVCVGISEDRVLGNPDANDVWQSDGLGQSGRRGWAGRRGGSGGRCRTAPRASSGLYRAQVSRLRQPQPMQPSSFSFIASSMAIRSSRIGCHELARRAQSLRLGVRRFGKRVEGVADVAQREPDPLRHADEADPPEHVGAIAAVPGVRALAVDEAVLLVEAQRGCRHAGTAPRPRRSRTSSRPADLAYLTSTMVEVLR